MSNVNYFHNLNFDAKKDAFSYQESAFNEIKDLSYSAIFHEQGLGKTKIAIDLILYWLEKKNIDTIMVVTKKQLIKNWEKELDYHTFIKPRILSSDKRSNFYVFNSTCRVILSNFEMFITEKERLELYLKTRNVAIVIDESTKIKNPESKLTQAFFDVSDYFKIKTIMTGTPVANRPFDIWAQIYFLDKGKSLGNDFYQFKRDTDLSNDLSKNTNKREKFEKFTSTIFNKINNFTVRETKQSGIIKLPNKNYFTVLCDFEKVQKDMYHKLKSDYALLIQKDDKTVFDQSEVSLKRLLRLIQLTSNPRLIDDFYCYESGKEHELNRLLLDIFSRGEKAIVWSMFIENVDYFSSKYSTYDSVKIHGSMKMEERNKAVEEFINNSKCKVLFATPQAAKEGLTLTVANNVVFYDRGFSLDDYLQAQDRIHRISQLKECNIYNLVIDDTVDNWVDLLLRAKQNAAFLAQGDFELAKYSQEIDYTYGNLIKEVLGIKEE